MNKLKILSLTAFSVFAISCSKSDSEVFMANCLDLGDKSSMKGMNEETKKTVQESIAKGCEMLWSECMDDEQGKVCQKYKGKYLP